MLYTIIKIELPFCEVLTLSGSYRLTYAIESIYHHISRARIASFQDLDIEDTFCHGLRFYFHFCTHRTCTNFNKIF